MKPLFPALLLSALALAVPGVAAAPADELPELGNNMSSAISPAQEYQLGRAWLRQLRGQSPAVADPIAQDYLERLSYRLAFNSPLQHPDLSLIIIRDRSINAFAVPGGVVGVNVGLLMNAETESETASVLAHELGHLSQRHFARQLEESKQNQWMYLAGFLTTIALAVAGENQGAAAMGATAQAAMINNRLSYSRLYEQEADRIGMQTLADAGMDPNAMPTFFQRMERQSRMAGNVPEFMLTHPLTGSRIADTVNRAQRYPRKLAQDSLDYQLVRMRFLVQFSPETHAPAHFQRLLVDTAPTTDRARILRLGLALSCLRERQFDRASEALAPLLAEDPHRSDYIAAAAEIELAQRHYPEAITLLEQALAVSPDSYPILIYYARAKVSAGEAGSIINRLEAAARERNDDVQIWRLLIDAYTQEKNALGVYRSRAEVYYLNGNDERALEQLKMAADSVKGNYPMTAKIQKRMREIQQGREALKAM